MIVNYNNDAYNDLYIDQLNIAHELPNQLYDCKNDSDDDDEITDDNDDDDEKNVDNDNIVHMTTVSIKNYHSNEHIYVYV